MLEDGYFGPPHIWLENSTSQRAIRLTARINRWLSQHPVQSSVTSPFVYWLARHQGSDFSAKISN